MKGRRDWIGKKINKSQNALPKEKADQVLASGIRVATPFG